jgi:hypothetical protein
MWRLGTPILNYPWAPHAADLYIYIYIWEQEMKIKKSSQFGYLKIFVAINLDFLR